MTKLEAEQGESPIHYEIERRFLVKEPPQNLASYRNHEIIQGYLSSITTGEIRIRQKDNSYFRTVKKGEGKVRAEDEKSISRGEFNSLWPLTNGARIYKTRYEIPYEGLIIEFDVYHGNLQGFVSIEVEFPTEQASNDFTPPDWFGQEVTEDSRYNNSNLARNGLSQT